MNNQQHRWRVVTRTSVIDVKALTAGHAAAKALDIINRAAARLETTYGTWDRARKILAVIPLSDDDLKQPQLT